MHVATRSDTGSPLHTVFPILLVCPAALPMPPRPLIIRRSPRPRQPPATGAALLTEPEGLLLFHSDSVSRLSCFPFQFRTACHRPESLDFSSQHLVRTPPLHALFFASLPTSHLN
jgi:hypothetical protein